MECDKNSNVLEFDFKMGQFLTDFFSHGIIRQISKNIKFVEYMIYVSGNMHTIEYRTYKPPILEINYPNGNFEDEYKYIYIQSPKITNFLQNCFSNNITGTNRYISYFEQNAPDFVSPVFKIADNNDTYFHNINWYSINQNDVMSIYNKLIFFDAGATTLNPIQINTPTENNLNSKLTLTTNRNFYLPLNLRNKNKLYLQLDLNYNNFALLLCSMLFKPDFDDSDPDYINSKFLIRNFQFTKTSITQYYLWQNMMSQQINIGEILDIPIQIFISKEAL